MHEAAAHSLFLINFSIFTFFLLFLYSSLTFFLLFADLIKSVVFIMTTNQLQTKRILSDEAEDWTGLEKVGAIFQFQKKDHHKISLWKNMFIFFCCCCCFF